MSRVVSANDCISYSRQNQKTKPEFGRQTKPTIFAMKFSLTVAANSQADKIIKKCM